MIYKTVILAARSSPDGQTHNKSLKQVFLHMCVRWGEGGEAGWLKVGYQTKSKNLQSQVSDMGEYLYVIIE